MRIIDCIRVSRWAAGRRDRPIVGDGLGADVVDRLVEGGIAAGGVGRTHLAGLDQRDRQHLVADRQRDALEVVLEAELEAQVFLGIAVVVDVARAALAAAASGISRNRREVDVMAWFPGGEVS